MPTHQASGGQSEEAGAGRGQESGEPSEDINPTETGIGLGLGPGQQQRGLAIQPQLNPLLPPTARGLGDTAARQQMLQESEFEYRQWVAAQKAVKLQNLLALLCFI